MNWFILDITNNDVTTFSDTPEAEKEVLEYISDDEGLKEALENGEAYIIRGERHEYVPPKNKGRLVKIAADK